MRKSVNQIIKKAVKDLISLGGAKIAYKTTTPIKLGLSMTDLPKVSYITEKRQLELIQNNIISPEEIKNNTIDRKKFFYHTSVEKIMSKFVDVSDIVGTSLYNKVLLEAKEQLFNLRKIKLSCFEGEQIGNLYSTECHKLGTMSCMQEKPREYFEIYENLPVKLYTIIFNGNLYARCLLWTYNGRLDDYKGRKYIDRIYTFAHNEPLSNHIYEYMIKSICKYEKIDTNTRIHAYNIRRTNLHGFSSPNFYNVRLDYDVDEFDYLPYMDTFQFLNNDMQTICSEEGEETHILKCTSGGYEEGGTNCECCGDRIDRDQDYYCEDSGETLCQNCVEWSEIDGVHYRHDLVTFVGGNVNSYVLNSEIG